MREKFSIALANTIIGDRHSHWLRGHFVIQLYLSIVPSRPHPRNQLPAKRASSHPRLSASIAKSTLNVIYSYAKGQYHPRSEPPKTESKDSATLKIETHTQSNFHSYIATQAVEEENEQRGGASNSSLVDKVRVFTLLISLRFFFCNSTVWLYFLDKIN